MKPTVGRIVLFVMPDRAEEPSVGGQIRPAIVVRVWERTDGEMPLVQLQVFIDGTNDGYAEGRNIAWATSVHHDQVGKAKGSWHWMEHQLAVAAPPKPLAALMRSAVRAKFRCTEKSQTPENGAQILLEAVTSGSEENKSFFKWTPGGQVRLGVVNPSAAELFEVGGEIYADFTRADPPAKSRGQIAYEAYCETTGWKSLATGADLPPWSAQKPAIAAAWEAAGAAVASAV